jgi:PKD domain
MRVRTYASCVAVALCAVLPTSASAAIDSIVVQPNAALADFLCLGSTTTSPVRLALTTVEGTTLQTLTLPQADDTFDTGCPGSTHAFEPGAALPAGAAQPAFGRYPAGARIIATQDGVSVAFALPYGAFASGTTRLRSLPNPAALTGGVVAASAPGTYTGAAATQGDPVTANGTETDSAAHVIPITETFTPARYRVSLESSTVRVLGADPLGGAVAATLSAPGGALLGRATLRPRVGADCSSSCSASDSFDAPPASGGTLAVTGQPGWFPAHTITLPSGSFRLDGFDVSIPTGYAGSYDFALRFFDPESVSSLAPSSPFRCLELGAAVTCPGGSPVNRLAVSAGAFVVPGDTVDVTGTDADGDVATITATAGGLSGSLDDGSVTVRGAPHAQLTAALRSPHSPPLDPYVESYTDRTDETGTDTLVDAFSVHIQNGATVTLSGPATGPIAQTFTWKLAASMDASGVVRGTTYGLAPVAVDLVGGSSDNGARTAHFQTTADVAGNFAVALGDVRAGDVVNVAAADATTHQMTTTTLGFGAPPVTITGVSDGQYVRGTVTPTVAGAGLDSVFWNGINATLPTLLVPASPFPYPLDTTKWDDGTYRLEASGRPSPGGYDYLYITIDNTPPNGSAGNDQTVARGSTAVIVTGASDDTSGLASVKVDFGDKHRLTQGADNLGNPIAHTYSKLGRYTVLVTITDGAGNVTSDSSRIRVATSVAPQVGGKFAGKLVRKKLLATKLTGRQPGQLEIFILSQTGARKLTKRVTFTKANQHIKVSLLTRGLKLGRFVLVEQFTDANGVAGPVQAFPLRVVKR